MDQVVLKAQPRQVIGKQVRALRRQGLLPGVIYGHRVAPIIISLDARDTGKILPHVSSSQLVTVDVNGQKHTVLVREKQRNPINGELLHVDFQEVSMTETLRIMVTVEVTGEAPAVKNYNGIVVTSLEHLEVESLPRALPSVLHVDLSGLNEIGDAIYVRDVVIPAGVKVLDDPDEVVVVITAPVSEVELAKAEGATAEPEMIEKGKKEEEF